MLGVILAAGQGKRLLPITKSRSKALVPVMGKPIIAWVMESLSGAGVDKFLVVVNPNDDKIREFFASHTHLYSDVDIVYQEKPIGMANALKCASVHIQQDFILTACDNLVSPDDIRDLLTVWQRSDSLEGILSLIHIEQHDLHRVGVVALNGTRVTEIVEKPNVDSASSLIASIPLYIFSPRILAYLGKVIPSRRGEYELQDAIQMLIDDGWFIRGVHVQQRQTVNDLDDLLNLNLHFFDQQKNVNVVNCEVIDTDIQIIPPVYIEANVEIEPRCSIGPNVFLERNSQIGAGSTLSNAVVLMSGVVPPESDIHHRIVI